MRSRIVRNEFVLPATGLNWFTGGAIGFEASIRGLISVMG